MSEETTTMAKVENLKTANKGFELHCEYRNFPITFVNALRRILLSSIPTVVATDVQILENTSQLPHEMIRHRVEMLPINIKPDDTSAIRDAKIELRMSVNKDDKGVKLITTDDFVVESNRPHLIMKDRDYDKPILFMRLNPGETIHLTARLALQTENVHKVCDVGTYWATDPERVKIAEKEWKDDPTKDIREFYNFYYQQCYSRYEDETQSNFGRPNLFGMNLESYGGLTAKELLKYAVAILRKNLQKYSKEALENITREKEEHSYSISLNQGGNTLGALMQEVIYGDMNVEFVSYDIPHLLLPKMVLRFHTKKTPESIIKTAVESIEEYCSLVEKAI